MTFDVKAALLKSETSKTRMKRIKKVLNELEIDVKRNIRYIKQFNSIQPYHNYQHLITVALNCYDAAKHYNLDVKTTRLLVLAALYHDIDHTGKADVPDLVNISQAISKTYWLVKQETNLGEEDLMFILNLILVTENSHKLPVVSLEEQIICDADLLQNIQPDNNEWFKGLSEELKFPVNLESSKKFLSHATFHTGWAQQKVDAFLERVV